MPVAAAALLLCILAESFNFSMQLLCYCCDQNKMLQNEIRINGLGYRILK